MSKSWSPNLFVVGSLAVLIGLSGCVWIYRSVEVEPVPRSADSLTVHSPIRVHFQSGRNAVFMQGAVVHPDAITSSTTDAMLYDLDLTFLGRVGHISMDSVAAVETYSTEINTDRSVAVSLLATTGALVATPFLMLAIFGSCPTVYSIENGEPVLDGESFSNSIVSLFEQRDVDPVRARASADGLVELEIRNEALETHYINHLELIEVRHAPSALALPGPDGVAYVLDGRSEATSAIDRAGRDVLPSLRAMDDRVFSTVPSTLAAARPDDLTDYIDLTFPAPEGDSAAVVLTLRNSLLNTVFFYEFMLAGQGAGSLDWLARDLESISYAVGIGDFYARHMGLRVEVKDGSEYREVGKISDVGPIAWDHVAVPVPATGSDSLHIRLRFIADSWRIDEVHLAADVRTTELRRVAPIAIASSSVRGPADPLEVTSESDDRYLVTMPGTKFLVTFDVGDEPETGTRSFFLAAQGYYTEWIRKTWLQAPADASFTPSGSTLHAAMKRWQEVKPAYEANFATSKIPVR